MNPSFLRDAWWVHILAWGLGALVCLAMMGTCVLLLFEGVERIEKGQRLAGMSFLLGMLIYGALWLGAAGYCGYRAYLAVP